MNTKGLVLIFIIIYSVVMGQKNSKIATQIDSIIKLSNKVFYSNPDSAAMFLEEAKLLAEKHDLKKPITRIYINYGILKNEAGKIEEAKVFFQKVVEIAKEINDTVRIIAAYGNLGNTYMITGEYEKSIEYFTKTIELYKKQGNEKGLSYSYGAMGNLYNNLLKYEKAIQYYNLANNIFVNLKDTFSQAVVDLNIGTIQMHQNKFDLAEIRLKNAVKYFFKNEMYLNVGKCQSALSKMYYIKGELEKAAQYAEQALDNYKATGANFDSADMIYYISELEFKKQNYKKALEGLDTAFVVAKSTNNYKQISKFASLMKVCYDSIGDYKNAYYYANIDKQYSDSILTINSANKFAELEVTFETKEKQHKIELLTKNEEILLSKERNNRYLLIILSIVFVLALLIFVLVYNRQKLKSEKVALEIEQKLLRLQMNPHFIFNSLYAIQNFLTQNDTEKTNKYLIKFSRLLRLILESSAQSYITIEEEIEIIENYLTFQKLLNNDSFEFEINYTDDIEIDNVLIPPMLVQPFIENSIKHGFKAIDYKGKIDISFSSTNNNLKISIIDNGKGLNGNKEDKDHKSMSTDITRKRLKSLIGKKYKNIDLVISENEKQGTKVQFEIPFITEF